MAGRPISLLNGLACIDCNAGESIDFLFMPWVGMKHLRSRKGIFCFFPFSSIQVKFLIMSSRVDVLRVTLPSRRICTSGTSIPGSALILVTTKKWGFINIISNSNNYKFYTYIWGFCKYPPEIKVTFIITIIIWSVAPKLIFKCVCSLLESYKRN